MIFLKLVLQGKRPRLTCMSFKFDINPTILMIKLAIIIIITTTYFVN